MTRPVYFDAGLAAESSVEVCALCGAEVQAFAEVSAPESGFAGRVCRECMQRMSTAVNQAEAKLAAVRLQDRVRAVLGCAEFDSLPQALWPPADAETDRRTRQLIQLVEELVDCVEKEEEACETTSTESTS